MVRTICETYDEAPVFFESFHADRKLKSGYIAIDRWNSMAGRQRFSQEMSEMSGGKRQAVQCARERESACPANGCIEFRISPFFSMPVVEADYETERSER
jgi:hypothetical protein